MTNDQRLRNIDFLRAFSILIVMFYHFRPFEGGELFRYGHYGVLLFFMISGYCIQYSIESSSGPLQFLIKRWVRLLPALLVVSLVIFFLKSMGSSYNLKDHYQFSLSDLFGMILNLPFIEIPRLVYFFVTGQSWSYAVPDSAFWSLFIEFQFYFIQALLMLFPRRRAIIWQTITLIILTLMQIYQIRRFNLIYDVGYFYPYFIIGIASALKKSNEKWILILGSISSIAVILYANIFNDSIPFYFGPSIFVCLLFFLGIKFAQFFSQWGGWLQTVGIVSYPLYLIHQHIGQKFLNFLNHYSNPSVFKVLFVVFVLFCFAWLVNRYIENPIQKWIKGRIR